MKRTIKKALPVLLVVAVLAMCGTMGACASSKRSGGEVMYERAQSNKGAKVKSNIKVKGSNKKNGRTTRVY